MGKLAVVVSLFRMAKVVVVTGCSSGLGKALALRLAGMEDKYKVYATMRTPKSISNEELPNLVVSSLDVTSDESVSTFFKDIPRVDILVNNAGFAINGTHESNSLEDARAQFETNFFGILRMHLSVLPLMRKQKSGHIIAVSSIGGILGHPMNDIYCASKFAVEGLYESIAPTNLQFGIQTSLVEPGAIRTDFVQNAQLPKSDDLPEDIKLVYNQYWNGMKATYDASSSQTAEEVAEVVVKAIADGEAQKASLRYQSSDLIRSRVGEKLIDLSGNSQVQHSVSRYFQ